MVALCEKEIFFSALDFNSDEKRAEYLAEACGPDHRLRHSVERLLAVHGASSSILDNPFEACEEIRREVEQILTWLEAPSLDGCSQDMAAEQEQAGTVLGNYHLLEKIGEGSFGQVWAAQQQAPIRRRVALKLLKLGLNSKEVVARFEAERQALAMMDHPNIARVFDAGTTATGRPFFVMELVRGVRITDFCDQQQLDIRQRLELFICVCEAVQHAHQKGVIHRDLKPSNILVSLHDDKPDVKVIDFGVSKAIGEPLTDKTIYTRNDQMIGTPMYMSPEQAQMNASDVDTRCDVFSLGMILYELLTGATPYDNHRLNAATFDELRKIIREEELPRPSSRASTLKMSTTTCGRRRQVKSSASQLRGDLDWIVMKAVEKDRGRRYGTTDALADDLRKHLNSEPIEARPPSSWYRVGKFARRHKVMLSAAVLVMAAMIGGSGFSIWQAARAVAERNNKEQALVEAERAKHELQVFTMKLKEANVLLASGRAHADAGRWSAAYADYRRATEIQPNYYFVWAEKGALNVRLGLWDEAAADYVKALRLDAPVSGAEWWAVPQLFLYTGNHSAFRTACQRMLEVIARDESQLSVSAIRSSVFGANSPDDPSRLAIWSERLLERNTASSKKSQTVSKAGRNEFGGAKEPGRFEDQDHRPPFGDRGGPPPDGRYGPSSKKRPPPPDGRRDRSPEDQATGFRSERRGPPDGEPADRGVNDRPEPPGARRGPPRDFFDDQLPDRNRRGFSSPPPERSSSPQDQNWMAAQPYGVLLYVAGMAHYRAGDYHKAAQKLEESMKEEFAWPSMVLAHPALAMTYFRLGRPDDARQSLERARESIDGWTTSLLQRPLGKQPVHWFDWIEYQLLFHEATVTVTGSPPPPDPRVTAIQQRACLATQ